MEEAATAKIAPKSSRLNPLYFRQKNLSEIPALQLLGREEPMERSSRIAACKLATQRLHFF